MKNQFIGSHLDFVGFSASLLCALHCVALPFLLSLASLTGLQFLNNPWIEYTIILVSGFIASYALIHGYLRHHQKPMALVIVVAGFALIGLGHWLQVEWYEIILTSCGAAVVAIAHLVNWTQIKQSNVEFPDCQ
ncbi:MerC domain-containing protein [Reichenbachiella agarivorans]|uniref:MerC domain-containing protein n=1 Tax=Reichenbachiella agarivorans TaxID=2979464 RepID=A0ABY6CR45_9BACT|nr:MerC domain-containing protein [Reichenbachiella agarivorans]UXP30780.1 MerC domain-containing protein [Reichenbachiella agarivorans]